MDVLHKAEACPKVLLDVREGVLGFFAREGELELKDCYSIVL